MEELNHEEAREEEEEEEEEVVFNEEAYRSELSHQIWKQLVLRISNDYKAFTELPKWVDTTNITSIDWNSK
jgi:hypothetical protein